MPNFFSKYKQHLITFESSLILQVFCFFILLFFFFSKVYFESFLYLAFAQASWRNFCIYLTLNILHSYSLISKTSVQKEVSPSDFIVLRCFVCAFIKVVRVCTHIVSYSGSDGQTLGSDIISFLKVLKSFLSRKREPNLDLIPYCLGRGGSKLHMECIGLPNSSLARYGSLKE